MVSNGCSGSGIRLFCKWSGVAGGDSEGDEGAIVGDEVTLEDGKADGSMSRSGTGGDRSGRRVMRRSSSRRIALRVSYW